MLEVTYITQTLRVYVHQENDQVMGYTGNVLGGDARMGGIIDVDIEYIGANGRTSSFAPTDSVKPRASGGVYTFRNVPADRNVIVTADEYPTLGNDADGNPIANTAHLLDKNGHSDEIAAYTDVDANGIMGGAFGAHGGFSHTVELCPLMSGEGDQRHGECGTFAFVETFAVTGQAWMWVVSKAGDDFGYDADDNVVMSKAGVAGLTVGMDPVEGENLADQDESFTDERGRTLKFDFGQMPAGVYKVTTTPSSGWIERRGPLESPTNDLDDYLTPLDTTLNIDVTPTTGYVYGTVKDSENLRLADVTVHVNGKTVTTDSNGRYIVNGFGRGSCTGYRGSNLTCVQTAEEGSAPTTTARSFSANSPTRVDITISDAAEVTWISGTVTLSSGGAGVDVRVWVDGSPPLNKNARTGRTGPNNIYITDSNGDYRVRIAAKSGGASAKVTVSQTGRFFSPDFHTVSAVAGADISGINFTAFDNGTIHGRVVDGDDDPISGVIVTANQVGGDATDADTTATTGTYSLSVRYGSYNVTAARDGHTFTTVEGVNVPNDGKAIDDIVGTAAEDNADLSSLTLSGIAFPTRANPFTSSDTDYAATVNNSVSMTTVRATPAVSGNDVDIYPDDADDDASGHQVALGVGDTDIEIEVTAADGTTTKMYTFTVTRRTPSTVISGTITDAVSGDGISGVVITVNGSAPLNTNAGPATARRLQTGSGGTYEAHVASTSGSGVVRATKADYTFDPATSTVTLNAGSVAGIDFTGSEYATITGRVMADGSALEGVTVEATSGGVSDDDETDRRGNFSVSVPAGTATVTAELTGYDFTPQTVFTSAGETRSLGDITATGNMTPVNVEATRDTDNGAYNGTVSVSWDAGPGGVATQYQVQTLNDG